MRRNLGGVLFLVAVAGLAVPVAGQEAPVRQIRAGAPGNAPQQARLPYTAEFKTTRVQTLADGSTITHESTEVMARDSEGRTYQLSSSASQGEDQRMHTSVDIDD